MHIFEDPALFKTVGVTGVIFGILGVLIPSFAYRGRKGERYSFLNHYISELGEVGVSRLAWVFNLGMIVCGICIVIASLSLGLLLSGFWAKAGLVLGVITGFALSMVGAFPMDNIKRHILAAVTFFRAGFLMVIAFSLAFVLQKGDVLVVSRWLGLAGLFPILAFGIFLGLMWTVRDVGYDVLSAPDLERPRVWKFAISEWSIYFAMIFWILVIALGIA